LISVALVLESEAVAKRESCRLHLPEFTVDAIIRAFCYFRIETEVYFRVRPFLPDPSDDFVLELAVAGRADAIVTHNLRHFIGADQFGIAILTPRDFWKRIDAEGA
jgi:predicted nucleic acid-binding protein